MAAGLAGLLVASLAAAIHRRPARVARHPGHRVRVAATGRARPRDAITLGPAGYRAARRGHRVRRARRPVQWRPSAPAGISLLAHPDSYAELGGTTFQTATAMGGLAYMTPLRVTWGARSAIAYKRDFGLGGGPVAGLPRVIDLWWQLAGALRIPYERGLWSGASPWTAAAGRGGGGRARTVGVGDLARRAAPSADAGSHWRAGLPGVIPAALRSPHGPRAELLAGGQAAAPAGAPAAVQGMIAAGNQIAGRPYLYGGGPRVAAQPDRAGLRLLEQRGPSALRRRAAAGQRRSHLGDARVLRSAGAGAVGDDLRQRGPRLHVRGRTALGHLERRRSPGRRRRASAGIRCPERDAGSWPGIRWACDARAASSSR